MSVDQEDEMFTEEQGFICTNLFCPRSREADKTPSFLPARCMLLLHCTPLKKASLPFNKKYFIQDK